jgi:ATP-dependent exoDNAse (exonuclease V) beta subunit
MENIGYASDLPSSAWASYLPAKEICWNIEPFREYSRQQEIEGTFDKLCNLYVAMTRAKRALYMLVACGQSSTTLAPDIFVRDQLSAYGCNPDDEAWLEKLSSNEYPATLYFSHGEKYWFGKYHPIEVCTDSQKKFVVPEFIPADIPLISTASGAETHHFTGNPAQRFAPLPGKVSGTLIHELFAQLEFVDDDFDAARFSKDLPADAAEIFCRALQPGSPVRELLRRPDGGCELWLERRFMLKTPSGEIVPGAFDRVQIFRENGVITHAQIIDYKSDRIGDPAGFSIYFPQLASYRRSLAILLELPESKISCKICALRLSQVIEVS